MWIARTPRQPAAPWQHTSPSPRMDPYVASHTWCWAHCAPPTHIFCVYLLGWHRWTPVAPLCWGQWMICLATTPRPARNAWPGPRTPLHGWHWSRGAAIVFGRSYWWATDRYLQFWSSSISSCSSCFLAAGVSRWACLLVSPSWYAWWYGSPWPCCWTVAAAAGCACWSACCRWSAHWSTSWLVHSCTWMHGY